MRTRVGARRAGMVALILLATAALGAGTARAYLVRGLHGERYGVMWKPGAHRLDAHASAKSVPPVTYHGGAVMLSSTLHLIFWGPTGSFEPSYTSAITQWAQDLAADSGKTTNEFSIGSLYYENHPRRYISRNVYFGGAVMDTNPYPSGNCENPSNYNPCVGDGQMQREIRRVIQAEHWPTDRPGNPRNQYLLFTPRNVDSCMDNRQHSCTFSGGDNGFCAYHGVFYVGQNAVVYSDLPYYISDCSPNQAPAGVFGNAQADATLDSTIHEVLESATDPESTDKDAWYGKGVVEVADACNYPYTPGDSAYGDPLGGSLSAHTAYNQVIHGHPYYTQEIWAPTTRFAPGCAQRIGPTPDFTATQSGSTMSFDGSYSYDLTRPLTTYVWNYGDGSPLDGSSGIRPRHVYAHPGTYQVSLTVLDATGLQNASTATQTEVVR